MQQEGDEEEERKPGHVEQGAGDRAADRLADRLEVAHRLDGRVRIARHHPLEDLRREQRIEAHARPDQQPVPDRVQRRQRQQRDGQREGDEQQSRLAARRHDAVVDLKHVDGGREEQQVDEQAEHRGRDEMRAAGLDGLRHVPRKFYPRDFHAVVLSLTHRPMIYALV